MRPILFAAAIGAAGVLMAAEAMAQCSRAPIPLPSRTLLTPPPEFDCAFKTGSADEASGNPQPGATRAQGDSSAAALRMKLDYERQCYRHAGMILRDGLRQLQAAVGETIKAVDRACPAAGNGFSAAPGPRASIPLPGRALLTPPPDFDCEFKAGAPDDAGGAPRAQADIDAALRVKLDYERQCYRHAEMILRDGLRQLQASVGETIKSVAVNRNERPASRPQGAAKQQSAAGRQRPADRKQLNAEEAPCAATSQGRCIARDPDARVRFMIRNDASDADL